MWRMIKRKNSTYKTYLKNRKQVKNTLGSQQTFILQNMKEQFSKIVLKNTFEIDLKALFDNFFREQLPILQNKKTRKHI